MDRSDVLTLIEQKYNNGADGVQKQQEETSRQVYCNVSSISGKEWMEAGRSGIKPTYRFTLFEPDYNGEMICEYHGKRYVVYRLYRSKNEEIELYVMEECGVRNPKEDWSTVYDL